jgi:N-acetylneuraminic acid mutarotase
LTDTWSAIAPFPMALEDLSAVSVGSAFYVLGDQVDGVATMFKFDTIEGSWSAVATLPVPIRSPAVCSVESDVYVFGGYDSEVDMLASVFKYDTLTDVWSTLTPMPRVCKRATARVT